MTPSGARSRSIIVPLLCALVMPLAVQAQSGIDNDSTSRRPGEPLAGVDDIHLHPAVPRTLRVSATAAS